MASDREKLEKKAYKKALRRGTRYRLPSVNYGVATASLFLCAVIAVCLAVIISRNGGGTVVDTTFDSSVAGEIAESPAGVTVTLSEDDMHRGDLILVNYEHKFVFPNPREDVSVYENKTYAYKVNDMQVTMSMKALVPFNRLMDAFYAVTECRDVMVVSGFRTEEFQRELYDERVASQGAEMAAKYVALPGMSEHHTGLAMDLSVYTDSGEGYYVREYEPCRWLVANFENFGFVLRYPEEKASITKISYESWHYRYVGLPHSLIMKEMDFCFEEYIEFLHTLGDGRAVVYSARGAKEVDFTGDAAADAYTVLYRKAASGDTEITLPEGRDYRVSGDNAGGFIITILPVGGDFEITPVSPDVTDGLLGTDTAK